MAGKTLVAYATKSGVNAEAANIIADALRKNYSIDVTVSDLKEKPDIGPYENVIVGSGVRAGQVYGDAVSFLSNDFGNRKVALYFCCGEGGGSKSHDAALIKDAQKALAKNPGLKPIDVGAFGGCMKILGKVVSDTRNMEAVKAWAIELGKKL